MSNHVAHIIGVEVGLAGVGAGMQKAAKIIHSRPYQFYPMQPYMPAPMIRPQPFRWGVMRFLGRTGNILEGKLFGRIPLIGPIIDVFTSSNTIMSHSEEMRPLREARRRREQEEFQRRQQALDSVRIKRPLGSTVRPEFWTKPKGGPLPRIHHLEMKFSTPHGTQWTDRWKSRW